MSYSIEFRKNSNLTNEAAKERSGLFLMKILMTTDFLRIFLKKIFNSISLFSGRPNLS